MTVNGWFQIAFFLLVVLAVTRPLGSYMTRVFGRERTWLDPVLRPLERLIYRLTGVDEKHDMPWTEYAVALLLFSVVSMAVLYLMQRLQHLLPLNPQKSALSRQTSPSTRHHPSRRIRTGSRTSPRRR
jgi:potassium-transporting ATPase potassium-binding subunit